MKVFALMLFSLMLAHVCQAVVIETSPDVQKILNKERVVGNLSPDYRLVPTTFCARLIVHLPESLAQAPAAVNGMAVTALSLASLVSDSSCLEEAWVSYDPAHQEWKAMWSKPPMFHFGMVLFPALLKKLSSGQAFTFESQGQPASVTKDDQGRLIVQRGTESSSLTASDLRDLLRSKINSDGMVLFLDESGNLILKASGQNALALSKTTQK
jgi:hypothetical protein